MLARNALLSLALCAAVSAFRLPETQPSSLEAPTAKDWVPAKAFGPMPHGGPNFTAEVPVEAASEIEAASSPKDKAIALAKRLYGSALDVVVHSSYSTEHNGVTHVHLRQVLRGVPIENNNMNVNVDKNGRILSHGGTFVKASTADLARTKMWGASGVAFVTPEEALNVLALNLQLNAVSALTRVRARQSAPGKFAFSNVDFASGEVHASQAYIQADDGSLKATWEFEVPMTSNWFHAHVFADGSSVASLNDWVANFADVSANPQAAKSASYRVVALGDDNPTDNEMKLVDDPFHVNASPLMWHTQDKDKKFTTTIGNNVYAQENWAGRRDYLNNKRPDGGASLTFDYAYDKITTDPKQNINGAVTNLFYWNNMVHDISYVYGFNEAAGNFQMNNMGKGGDGNDAVVAQAQDGSGKNNANFATPPDGQNGWMRMYVFNTVTPSRDGDFSPVIITHEYTHGISNRLVGGPKNVNCLGWGQPGSMGEGWGDWFGVILEIKPEDTRKRNMPVGQWVWKGKTIRHYDYSTDVAVNPITYSWLSKGGWSEVHAAGEIWANTLYEMFWNLVETTGKFNPDWFARDMTAGNQLSLQLVLDAMKLAPCSPSFLNMRDAILQAEKQLTQGKYACAIWRAFAKRGMGSGATNNPVKEATDLPAGC